MTANTHDRDKMLTFDPQNHIYYINDQQCLTSVTGLVGKFFPDDDFNPEETIKSYWKKWQKEKHPLYYKKTQEQIKKMWDDDYIKKGDLGTKLHKAIEDNVNGKKDPDINEIEKEYGYYKTFINDNEELTPYRSEWKICTDLDVGIAGTVDMCFTRPGDPPNTVHLYDWKRTNKINSAQSSITQWYGERFHPGTGLYLFDDILNIKLSHYNVQLNIYRHILETYYGLHVASMNLAVFHPEKTEYELYAVQDLRSKVAWVMNDVRANPDKYR